MNDTNGFCGTSARCGDFAKSMAFEIEKSGRSRTLFLNPAHQLAVSMRIMRKFTDVCGGSQRTCP